MRVNDFGQNIPSRAGGVSSRGLTDGGPESGVETAPKGGTTCPRNDTLALEVWRVCRNGQSPLSDRQSCPIVRTHHLQGVNAFLVLFQL